MTARDMLVAFENRILQIRPDLELTNKLSSDVIFEFLNAATLRFCRESYVLEDSTETGSRAFRKVNDALKGLSTRVKITANKPSEDESTLTTYMVRVLLPPNFMYYIRSTSEVSKTYKWNTKPSGSIYGNDDTAAAIDLSKQKIVTPNKVIKEDEIDRILTTYYNRPILLNPYVVLTESNETDQTSDPTQITDPDNKIFLNVIHDSYTKIDAIDLYYYRRPHKFDVIGVDGKNILDHCELAENVHMEIVELAIQMFLNDTRYAVADGAQPATQQQQRRAQ